MTAHFDFSLSTARRCEILDISGQVAAALDESGIRDGICLVSVPHTTAGVLVNENADPDVRRDVTAALSRIFPEEGDYRHAEGNSDAHLKAILTGNSLSLPVRGGVLHLGTWQGIFFAEYDGPRRRKWSVDILGEAEGA